MALAVAGCDERLPSECGDDYTYLYSPSVRIWGHLYLSVAMQGVDLCLWHGGFFFSRYFSILMYSVGEIGGQLWLSRPWDT